MRKPSAYQAVAWMILATDSKAFLCV